MKVIIKQEIKNFLKNPIFWIGLIVVIFDVYRNLAPYLSIQYFTTEQVIKTVGPEKLSDVDIMDGYLPANEEQKKKEGLDQILQTFKTEFGYSEDEIKKISADLEPREISDIVRTLAKVYHYNGAEYVFDRTLMHQGNVSSLNESIKEHLSKHDFSYYFSLKFADFSGLAMCFFASILFVFLFYRDMRRNTYELLHTKAVTARQYVFGKIIGGFTVLCMVIILLNIIFMILSAITAANSGFPFQPLDFIKATILYILPNMLMILSVYSLISLLFKNPLPAVPLLLAILVRFPGLFFDTTPPPMVLLNQCFLLIASVGLMFLSITIWKRRRVY